MVGRNSEGDEGQESAGFQGQVGWGSLEHGRFPAHSREIGIR